MLCVRCKTAFGAGMSDGDQSDGDHSTRKMLHSPVAGSDRSFMVSASKTLQRGSRNITPDQTSSWVCTEIMAKRLSLRLPSL